MDSIKEYCEKTAIDIDHLIRCLRRRIFQHHNKVIPDASQIPFNLPKLHDGDAPVFWSICRQRILGVSRNRSQYRHYSLR